MAVRAIAHVCCPPKVLSLKDESVLNNKNYLNSARVKFLRTRELCSSSCCDARSAAAVNKPYRYHYDSQKGNTDFTNIMSTVEAIKHGDGRERSGAASFISTFISNRM